MGIHFIIERMVEADMDELFRFRSRIAPGNTKLQDRLRWQWLYVENPEATEGIPFWVLKDAGHIVGCIGAIPVRMKFGDITRVSGFGSDFFVDKSYQGLPALRLLNAMLAAYPLNVSANVSDAARRLFGKKGFRDFSHALAKAWAGLPAGMRRIPGWQAQAKGRSLFWLRKGLGAARFEVAIQDTPPDGCDDLWLRIAPGLRAGVVKDHEYLRWRYWRCPSSPYRFVSLSRNGKPHFLGVVAVRGQNRAGEGIGLIVDLLVANGDYPAMLAGINACLQYLAQRDCLFCEAHLLHAWSRRCFRLMGFSLTRSPMGLMLRAHSDVDANALGNEGRGWAFMAGDTDLY